MFCFVFLFIPDFVQKKLPRIHTLCLLFANVFVFFFGWKMVFYRHRVIIPLTLRRYCSVCVCVCGVWKQNKKKHCTFSSCSVLFHFPSVHSMKYTMQLHGLNTIASFVYSLLSSFFFFFLLHLILVVFYNHTPASSGWLFCSVLRI